jgi:hypothetical protein
VSHQTPWKSLKGIPVSQPLFLPNLTLWYDWHAGRGTLPSHWRDWTLPQIASDLGVPAWLTYRPFRVDAGDVTVAKAETTGERVIRHHSPLGTLTERWSLGPDGDWWETEFPVKTPTDLRIAKLMIEQRTYVLLDGGLAGLRESTGEVALELPRRPFSQVFLEWLGWSDGLMLFFDAQDLAEEIVDLLEAQVQALVEQVAALPGDLVVSPDNLDAQFISPAFFKRYLANSYRRSADTLHAAGKSLLVGTGGPIRKLIAPLAAAGVAGIEGISGPPQSDATLAEARQLAGPSFILWGGIPQDALLADFDLSHFEQIVAQAAREAAHDSPSILGIADRVPVTADIDRLRRIPQLIEQTR